MTLFYLPNPQASCNSNKPFLLGFETFDLCINDLHQFLKTDNVYSELKGNTFNITVKNKENITLNKNWYQWFCYLPKTSWFAASNLFLFQIIYFFLIRTKCVFDDYSLFVWFTFVCNVLCILEIYLNFFRFSFYVVVSINVCVFLFHINHILALQYHWKS